MITEGEQNIAGLEEIIWSELWEEKKCIYSYTTHKYYTKRLLLLNEKYVLQNYESYQRL